MSDLPKRIWTNKTKSWVSWKTSESHVEYLRADLLPGREARLLEALKREHEHTRVRGEPLRYSDCHVCQLIKECEG